FRERLRQRPGKPRALEARGGIVRAQSLARGERVEAAQGGDEPAGAARARVARFDLPGEMAVKILRARLEERAPTVRLEPCGEAREVAPVAVERVPREAVGEPEPVAEAVERLDVPFRER